MKTKIVLFIIMIISVGGVFNACKKADTKPDVEPCPYFESQNLKIIVNLKEKNPNGDSVWKDKGEVFCRIDQADPKNITVLIKNSGEFLFSFSAAKSEVKKIGKSLPSYQDIYFSQCGLSQGWYTIKQPPTGIYIYQSKIIGSTLCLEEFAWGIWGAEGQDYSLIFFCHLSGSIGTPNYMMGITSSDMWEELGGCLSGTILMSVRLPAK